MGWVQPGAVEAGDRAATGPEARSDHAWQRSDVENGAAVGGNGIAGIAFLQMRKYIT